MACVASRETSPYLEFGRSNFADLEPGALKCFEATAMNKEYRPSNTLSCCDDKRAGISVSSTLQMILTTSDPRSQAARDAIHAGDHDTLRNLLKEYPELANAYIGDATEGRTLLHILADWPGHITSAPELARVIVAAGADINAPFMGDLHSETALHWAASNNDVALLDILLDLGSNIDAEGGVIDKTPLADARAFLQVEAAHRLISRGAEATLQDLSTLGLLDRVRAHYQESEPTQHDTDCAFWNACHGSQLATAQLLREKGANYNVVPPWENLTPLDAAQRNGATDVVQWLQELGALEFKNLI